MDNIRIIQSHLNILIKVLEQSKIDYEGYKRGEYFKKNPKNEWKNSRCRQIMCAYQELLIEMVINGSFNSYEVIKIKMDDNET